MLDFENSDLRSRLFVSMSAHFLTEQLPDEAIDWDEDAVIEFAKNHAWEPFEYFDPKDVVELINATTLHAMDFLKAEMK